MNSPGPARGPGSLNAVTAPLAPSTTVTVRRVSPPIGVNVAGTPACASAEATAAPVTPPASPSTSTSAPSMRRVRATFRPLPPGLV